MLFPIWPAAWCVWRGSLCAPVGHVVVGHCGCVLPGGNIASEPRCTGVC